MFKQRSAIEPKLSACACLLGALLLAVPASASPPQRGESDGVFSLLGLEFCLGERPGVDCDIVVPERWLADQPNAEKQDAPRKFELLGLTMCMGVSGADCDIELPWRGA